MKERPTCVIRMAKYHWMMAGTIVGSVVLMYVLTLATPLMPFSSAAFAITLPLAGLYVLTGFLLWKGHRAALVLNQICSLPYLTRPRMSQEVWSAIRSQEYKDYFKQEP